MVCGGKFVAASRIRRGLGDVAAAQARAENCRMRIGGRQTEGRESRDAETRGLAHKRRSAMRLRVKKSLDFLA